MTYEFPLGTQDREELFRQWRELNPGLWEDIVSHALWLRERGHRRISTKYLVEWARYEHPARAVGVPFVDQNGVGHVYRINNNDTALMGRLLLKLYPDLPIETRTHA